MNPPSSRPWAQPRTQTPLRPSPGTQGTVRTWTLRTIKWGKQGNNKNVHGAAIQGDRRGQERHLGRSDVPTVSRMSLFIRRTDLEMGEQRRESGGLVKEKCAKTQKHEMIQQDGELHKPASEAEALSTRGPVL